MKKLTFELPWLNLFTSMPLINNKDVILFFLQQDWVYPSSYWSSYVRRSKCILLQGHCIIWKTCLGNEIFPIYKVVKRLEGFGILEVKAGSALSLERFSCERTVDVKMLTARTTLSLVYLPLKSYQTWVFKGFFQGWVVLENMPMFYQ